MYNINTIFYKFNKKVNSTKRPNEDTPQVAVKIEIMEPVDILTPTLKIVDTAPATEFMQFNYVKIGEDNGPGAAFGRYYYITSWNRTGGVYYATTEVDPLASWRGTIHASEQYVVRSSRRYNVNIIDNNDILLPDVYVEPGGYAAAPTGWNPDKPETALGGRHWVIGVINSESNGSANGVVCYACNASGLNDIREKLFGGTGPGAYEIQSSNDYYNPINYIKFCKYYPFSLHPGALASQSQILIGPYVPIEFNGTKTMEEYRIDIDAGNVYEYIGTAQETINFVCPIPKRTGYLNSSHGSSLQLLFPSIGCVELNPNDYYDSDNLYIRLVCDVITGDAIMYLSTTEFSTGTGWHVTNIINCHLGAELPLTQVSFNYRAQKSAETAMVTGTVGAIAGAAASAVGAVASAVTYNPVGVAAGITGMASSVAGGVQNYTNAVASAYDAKKRAGTTIGAQSGFAAAAGYDLPRVIRYYQNVKQVDINLSGKPLYERHILQNLTASGSNPGFVKCENARIDNDTYFLNGNGSMMLSERSKIVNYLNGGVYLE